MTGTYNVVVLGSGGAGLVAAAVAADAGASVALVEKAEQVGGTTSLSGGTTWLPVHPHQPPEVAATARADALAYLGSLSHDLVDPDLAAAFVDAGPEFVRWVEAATAPRYTVVPGLPDYHPEHPGGRPTGGRSLDPGLFPFTRLGTWADRVVRPARTQRMTLTEVPLGGGRGVIAPEERARRRTEDVRGCGHALVGTLLAALLERGVEPRTSARARRLLTGEGSRRVVGVVVDEGGVDTELAARSGVVLATGGFENDRALVRAFLHGPMTSPAGVPTTTGDGLRMAMDVGADLAMMREAWWVPTIEVPGEEVDRPPSPRLLLRERTVPGSIMVDRAAGGSPTRPPTTTRSAARCTSSTPRRSPTRTYRAGWSSPRPACAGTGSSSGPSPRPGWRAATRSATSPPRSASIRRADPLPGRLKDMIKLGGENVAALEVEAVLATHPAVATTAVVGIPHPRLTEVPAAFVELRAPVEIEALLAHCHRDLADFKVPRHVRVVTAWPMSATKIQKSELAAILAAELADRLAEPL